VATSPYRRALLALPLLFIGMPVFVRAAAPTVTVDAALTVAAELPDASLQVMLEEVEGIWRSAGVRIRWVDAADARLDSRLLRVVVVRRPTPPGQHGNWVVGELQRFEDGRVMAIASIARAEAVIGAAGGDRVHQAPDALVHHRLGVVLGRAVAHELGHYLREDGAHTGRGLMRATFQPREFIDLRSGTFEVDAASRQQVLQRRAAYDAPDRIASRDSR